MISAWSLVVEFRVKRPYFTILNPNQNHTNYSILTFDNDTYTTSVKNGHNVSQWKVYFYKYFTFCIKSLFCSVFLFSSITWDNDLRGILKNPRTFFKWILGIFIPSKNVVDICNILWMECFQSSRLWRKPGWEKNRNSVSIYVLRHEKCVASTFMGISQQTLYKCRTNTPLFGLLLNIDFAIYLFSK